MVQNQPFLGNKAGEQVDNFWVEELAELKSLKAVKALINEDGFDPSSIRS